MRSNDRTPPLSRYLAADFIADQAEPSYFGVMKPRFLIVAATMALTCCQPQPKRTVWVKITSVSSPYNPKYQPGEVLVEFESNDGLVGGKTMQASLNRCQIGDTVRATAQGITLKLDEKACLR